MPNPTEISRADVAELIRIAHDRGLSEITVRAGSARVEIRLAQATTSFAPSRIESQPDGFPAPAPTAHPTSVEVLSPMTGVFYLSASPNDPPFVNEGDIVHEGDTIGLIEAMKVFSEVLSDVSGRVQRILTSNGQLVQQGEPLVQVTAPDAAE